MVFIQIFLKLFHTIKSVLLKLLCKNKKKGMVKTPDRNISVFEITENICLLSKEKKNTKLSGLKLEEPQNKPLVVLLAWMMAQKKHTFKYADIYIKKGFDVLAITVSPWQFLWPGKGTQLVAADIIKFLDQNKSYSPLLLHGFSVGGYLWGEVMVQMAKDPDRYQNILDRIEGQVWDSAVDFTEIQHGLPIAVFPNNKILATALGKYMIFHLKMLYQIATRHYIRSSNMFHTNLVKAPALLFLSKTDTIGTVSANGRVRDSWERLGIQVDWLVFDKSPHVGHYQKHPEEYTAKIYEILDIVDLSKKGRQEKSWNT